VVVEVAIGDGVTLFVCFLVDEDFDEDLFVVEIDNVLVVVFVVLGFLLAFVADSMVVVVVVVVVAAVIFLFSFVFLFSDDD
jgi:Flp pilus assembly protein protease CpaA